MRKRCGTPLANEACERDISNAGLPSPQHRPSASRRSELECCSQKDLHKVPADDKLFATGCPARPDVALISDIIVEYSDPMEPVSARNLPKRPILDVT
ncbi:hypothetical protein GX50_03422 [[Emmonsia] crescens]|uniref:Uncharacterized protein n=1 Tax=[Emmonsia] crescens TaxID=73230 RepID=A0A2B7ZJG0_9EURO|nr:hypothetical protein GX50_03422 [Emmonsia crescens]